MGFPLDSKLDNGSTVADWLGTAALAAAMAARKLTDVREHSAVNDPNRDLADAEQYLGQALNEVGAVRTHLVRRARPDYDPRVDHPERFMSEDVWQI